MIIDKEKRDCKIIDVVLTGVRSINAKELEKIEKNEELRLQVLRLWNVKTTVIPVVTGALRTISDNIEKHLKGIGISIGISCLQKVALLGTVFIPRRVLGISESK